MTRLERIGKTTISDKILVAYATRNGSTAEVAEAIGKTLAESLRPLQLQ